MNPEPPSDNPDREGISSAPEPSSSDFIQSVLSNSGVYEAPLDPTWGKPEKESTILGDFILREAIGSGGMGRVFEAQQRSTSRHVAVKILNHSNLGNRFEREVTALSKLDHPGIVRIISSGFIDGRYYIAMDLVRGRDLDKEARANRLTLREAARIVAKVAAAVSHAHERDVFHRDLKPSNILIDSSGEPHLTDFGLAQVLDAPGITKSNQWMGTPDFMAPEQFGRGPIDAEAIDVYGLGATLYWLITGHPPGQSPQHILAGRERISGSKTHKPPLELSRTDQTIDPDLKTICLGCLDAVPSQRYRKAAHVREDLERWLRREPILRRPPGLPGVLALWILRNPALATMTAVALVALVAGSIATLWQLHRTQVLNADLVREISTSRLILANQFLASDAAPEAARILARQLRSHPEDARAAQRLASTLENRTWALPIHDLIAPGWIQSLTWHPDSRRLLSVSGIQIQGPRQGILWDAMEGVQRAGPTPFGTVSGESRFSPDGQRLLTAFLDASRMHDTATLKPLGGDLPQNPGSASIAWLPDSRRFVLAGTNAALLLSVDSRDRTRFLVEKTLDTRSRVICVAVSTDGRWVAGASVDGEVRVWETSTGRTVLGPLRHESPAVELSFSKDRLAVMMALGHGVVLHSLPEGTVLGHWRHAERGELTPEPGHLLLSQSFTPSVSILDDRNGQSRREWPQAMLPWPAIFSGGRSFLVFDDAVSLRPYALDSLKPRAEAVRTRGRLPLATLSPDGRLLATSDRDSRVTVWRLPPPAISERLGEIQGATGIAISPDWQATIRPSEVEFRRRGRRSGDADNPLWRTDGPVEFLDFDPERSEFVVAKVEPETLLVWDVERRQQVASLRGISARRVILRGTRLAALTHPWSVHQWDLTRPDHPLAVPPIDIRDPIHLSFIRPEGGCLAYSRDGRLLFVAGRDGLVQAFAAGTVDPVWADRHTRAVTALVVSPDGRHLVTASEDRTAQIRDPQTGKATAPILSHTDEVFSAAFDSSGERLLTAGRNGRMTVWDVQTGKLLHAMGEFAEPLVQAAFAGDRQVVSVSENGTVRVFDAESGQRLEEAVFPSRPEPITRAVVEANAVWLARNGLPVHRLDLTPQAPSPDWLPELSELLTDGDPKGKTLEAFQEVHRRISEAGVDDPWSRWGRRWLGRMRADERKDAGTAESPGRPEAQASSGSGL